MSTPLLVQTLVIALIVAWSAVFAAHRLLPVASRRLQARVVDTLNRPSSPTWLRVLAQRLQPRSTSGGSCGDGCSSCGGCAAAIAKPVVDVQPLVFRSRTKA